MLDEMLDSKCLASWTRSETGEAPVEGDLEMRKERTAAVLNFPLVKSARRDSARRGDQW